jgi:hypothetical protein
MWVLVVLWGLVLALLIFGRPALAIVTERFGRTIPRGRFALWLTGAAACCIFGGEIPINVRGPTGAPAPLGLAIFVGLLSVVFFYNRAVVRRLRDAGHGKALAYFGLIPFVNVAVAVYLLIKPTAAGRDVAEPASGPAD